MTKFANVTALRDSIVSGGNQDSAWAQKMLHKIPDLPVVKDRAKYLVEKAKDKIVLDIGCTGIISAAINAASKVYYGFDKEAGNNIEAVDLDGKPDSMPVHEDVEIVICSEMLEHLSNPGNFLRALKDTYPERTVYFTVPNAGAYLVKDGAEVVNSEHVCWYSYQTLLALLTRYHYKISAARWYNGKPYTAEGIIMVAR